MPQDQKEDKLDLILKKLDDLEKRVAKIEDSCSNMDSHISFIERTYDSVKGYFGSLLPYSGDSKKEIKLYPFQNSFRIK